MMHIAARRFAFVGALAVAALSLSVRRAAAQAAGNAPPPPLPARLARTTPAPVRAPAADQRSSVRKTIALPPLARPAPPAPGTGASIMALAPTVQASAPPAGATARCRDGTYLYGPVSPASCGGHQGLAAAFPPARPAPPPPRS